MRALVLLAALGVGVAALAVHDRLLARREAFPADIDVLYVPPPDDLVAMSLGYREALADLIWIRALVYSGQRITDNDLAAIGRYEDAITGLAPRFLRAYKWGGVTMIYGGKASVDRDMVDRAIAIYRRGIAQFPESHELLYPLGMLLTYQVGSTPGYSEEEREALAAEGRELIRKAAAFGADPLVRQYAATLVSDHATEQLAIQFLESQLATTDDEDYRRMLRYRLDKLGAGASIERIEAIRRSFATEQAARAPEVPDTIWALIRDPHAAPGQHPNRE